MAMTAEELNRKYAMRRHVENGTFVELGEKRRQGVRDDHGAIYYYVTPGERTAFHRIDCDEYWCYHCGEPLEVCLIDESGIVKVIFLGIGENCEPLLLMKKGTIFASKSRESAADGTFLSCVTVPRFSNEGFEMFTDEEIRRNYSDTVAFLGE